MAAMPHPVAVSARLTLARAFADAARATSDDTVRAEKERHRRELLALLLLLRRGQMSRSTFLAQAHGLLLLGVTHAAIMGGADATTAQRVAGGLLTDKQPYLDRLAGDFDGNAGADHADRPLHSEAQAGVRAALWAGLLWSGYQAGKAEAEQTSARGRGAVTMVGYWELSGGSDHCGDCIALADGSPYPLDAMPTWPGAGDTACSGRCECSVEVAPA